MQMCLLEVELVLHMSELQELQMGQGDLVALPHCKPVAAPLPAQAQAWQCAMVARSDRDPHLGRHGFCGKQQKRKLAKPFVHTIHQ